MTVSVLHPINGVLNPLCLRGEYEYEHITTVECESLEEAFRLSQNDFSEEYSSLNKRSTSVGDIMIVDGVHYFISGISFTEIPHTVATYVDWTNH